FVGGTALISSSALSPVRSIYSSSQTSAGFTGSPANPAAASLSGHPMALGKWRSERRRVCARQATVDEEGRRGDERGVGAREECDRGGELLGPSEAADRHMHQAACGALRILREQLLQQRRIHWSRAQGIHSDALASELDAELAGHCEHAPLRSGV